MWLAQTEPSLEDVFQSMRDNFDQGPQNNLTILFFVLAAAMLGLLVYLNRTRLRQVMPKPVNDPAKLAKETLRGLGLAKEEQRELHKVAAEAGLASGLTLLLCPSLLAKTMADKTGQRREALMRVIKRLDGG
jgi:hypothetical protein